MTLGDSGWPLGTLWVMLEGPFTTSGALWVTFGRTLCDVGGPCVTLGGHSGRPLGAL